MICMNRVTLVGYVGSDPEMKTLKSGVEACSFSVATKMIWKSKANNQKQESTEWHRCMAWNVLAGVCGKYLHKGSKVLVEGMIKTRKWNDKNGDEKQIKEIEVSNMILLGGSENRGGVGSRERGKPGVEEEVQEEASVSVAAGEVVQASAGGGVFEDEDIPF